MRKHKHKKFLFDSATLKPSLHATLQSTKPHIIVKMKAMSRKMTAALLLTSSVVGGGHMQRLWDDPAMPAESREKLNALLTALRVCAEWKARKVYHEGIIKAAKAAGIGGEVIAAAETEVKQQYDAAVEAGELADAQDKHDAALDAESKKNDAKLNEKEAELKALKDELNEKNAELDKMHAKLAEKDAELKALKEATSGSPPVVPALKSGSSLVAPSLLMMVVGGIMLLFVN